MGASIPTSDAAPTAQDFRTALALLPGGVNVITTDGPAGMAGFTASAVCSVTDSPPTVLVCMNRSSFAHQFFKENARICVNVLSGDQQALSQLFSDRNVSMPERFERSAWERLATGAPALSGALASLDGVIVATQEVGTHSVFFVELRQIRAIDEPQGVPGLVYYNRCYHQLRAPAPM